MNVLVLPDLTSFAFSVLLVMLLMMPYLAVRYFARHRTGNH